MSFPDCDGADHQTYVKIKNKICSFGWNDEKIIKRVKKYIK